MACLRHEIASKIGPKAIAGELATTPQLPDSKELSSQGDQNDSDALGDKNSSDQNLLKRLLNPFELLEIISKHKIQILIILFAFAIGRFFTVGRKSVNHIIGSYDLELEVLREMNVSKIPSSPASRIWASQKFQRTHSQLNNLHEDFTSVRRSIWNTLQRVNELERRVYKAEMAALLGDRLLTCYDQMNSPACLHLQEQWKTLLKGKQ